jgi:hypothetical protein
VPHLSDEVLKDLVYGLMVDECPGMMTLAEVVWDNHSDVMEQLSETQQDEVYDRLTNLVRRARVTITFDDAVE